MIKRGRPQIARSVKGSECSLPSKPGLYRHICEVTGDIEYIGHTSNLRRRQQEHVSRHTLDLKYQRIEFMVAEGLSNNERRDVEVRHIAKHKPVSNKTKGRNGR